MLRKSIIMAVVPLAAFFALGEADAQDARDGQDAETTESAADVPESDVVPDNRKASTAREHLDRMREALTRVLGHLQEAREERDVVKLNCVNEKLTAIKGLLKISEQADVAMQEALARRNSEVANHEFRKVAVAVTKTEQLLAESEACVGESAVYSGTTEVEVEIVDEPTEDISEETTPTSIVDRPPAASPYQ